MSGIPLPLREALSSQYRVERELGRGGMASVYLARDLKHQRPVALKVMREEIAVSLGADRFLREIEIAARLQHPHILPLFDSGEAGGLLYYVMPYVEGETLRGRLQRERQLPVEDACAIARQIAGALAYAHSQGVIHRDIKPENILLSAGVAVVADFGIAKALSAASAEPGETSAGLAIGTPMYMSPEQASGGTVDGRSDLYALACLLFEMLAGAPPFSGDSPQAIIMRHIAESPPSLRSARPATPPMLQRVIERALAKAPADRFATVWQFGEAIGQASGGRVAPTEGGALATPAGGRPELGAPTSPNLGPYVHKTCNRWGQVNAFDAFFRATRKAAPGRPMAVVIHGEEGEGHESLIERLLATRIAHLANQLGGQERGVVPRVRTHWPTGDSLEVRQRDLTIGLFREADPRYLGEDLSAGALRQCHAFAPAPIVVIQHDLRTQQWDDVTPALLEWYLRDYWGQYAGAESDPQFLLFLKVVYPPTGGLPWWRRWLARQDQRRGRIQQHLSEILRRIAAGCPGIVLAELGPVTVDDVTDWFHRNGIYLSEQRRRAAAEALFARRPVRRLSEVEHALETIHREFIREHLLERGSLP
jgi:protein kinase-like protein/iSTAND domain-containing protein